MKQNYKILNVYNDNQSKQVSQIKFFSLKIHVEVNPKQGLWSQ